MIFVIVFILGLAIGSFLNAYIFRMREGDATPSPGLRPPSPAGRGTIGDSSPRGRGEGEGSVWRGRSKCPKCQKTLQWYELIPLLSFALQRGRCRGCKKKIDVQYPLVEMATGILFVLVYIVGLPPFNILHFTFLILRFYLLSALIVLFVYDLRYGLVPDKVVLPAIGVAALYTVIASVAKQSHEIATGRLLSALAMTVFWILLAIAVGAGFFWIQYVFSKGRWLGAGDIRIGALMGAMLGWPLIFEGLVISYGIGGVFALLLIAARKKQFGQTLPLGTFLTLGTVIVFLYGEQIWKWYWRI